MKVRVYWHVRRTLFSVCVQELSGKGRMRWVVQDHVEEYYLRDVQFYVSEAGRRRVVEEQRKNVHAWLVGTRDDSVEFVELEKPGRVSYNPYADTSFMVRASVFELAKYGVDRAPIHQAPLVKLSTERVGTTTRGGAIRRPVVYVQR